MGLRNFINDITATAKAEAKLQIKTAENERLEKENYILSKENKELKNDTYKFVNSILDKIYYLREDNNKEILEYDKRQRINSAANDIQKICVQFMAKKELDRPENSI